MSEEQELLQETLRGLIAGECPPSRLREIFDAGDGFDPAIWSSLAETGLLGLCVPEAHGGAGLGILELALVAEVAGGAALPVPLLEHTLACLAISAGGSDAQQARWLPALAAGERVATLALGEANGCFAPEDWKAQASDGKLVGEKAYVPHALRAGVAVVGVGAGAGAGALAIVDLEDGNVSRSPQDGIDRGRPIGSLRFDRCAADLLESPDAPGRLRDAGLVTLAADAFGAAGKLIALCTAYAKDRKQFGFPIAQFQAVKHQIARMGTDIEPTRALWWYAAHALDTGLPDAERSAAMAKAHITDRAMVAAREAVELHGGLGFTWECDVQIFFKRAMFDRAFLGTPEVHRERSAALAGW